MPNIHYIWLGFCLMVVPCYAVGLFPENTQATDQKKPAAGKVVARINGKPIYEGTGDLRSDVDELIYFIPEKHEDGSMTVSTDPDKTRGKFIILLGVLAISLWFLFSVLIDRAAESTTL